MAVILLGLLPPSRYVGAYLITSPEVDDFWYIGSKKPLRWTSVNSDPANFSIAITNQDPNTYPTALSTLVVKGLPKKMEKYEMPASAIRGLKEGSGYQVNIMSVEGGAILAQSPPFTISREDDETGMGDGVDNDQEERIEEELPTSDNEAHDVHKAKKGKDDIYRYQRLSKTHHNGHIHKHARPFRSRQRLQQAKRKSNALYNSTPKFDHSRSACSRSPRNPRVAKVVRV
ncbi:hypothetical protein PCANC_12965 [Puccinia coronata f. sp. avenae]|uniref:Yeast cell wall synthesis Kre9/Knh1-like N-terminal domain-containing protein n=1 Tax=Puccinia coronata f. sp. avenae TaxID=200324 RepID=A0A2N5SMQ6_9BASI|nr:hypothetical protein PCANC_12965 [Puccinia coronata f. sp. avenae]PLW29730.1 hypothetical protein PCASD_15576 [Puccinia coronata f. sp. avenae]